jgi:alkaline phosphatase
MKKSILYLLIFLPICLFAQEKSSFKLHSHNDYLRNVPFWEAYSVPCQSIEVDVILENNQLMVAHERQSIKPENTLLALYLDPIRKAKEMNAGKNPEFQLLIDLKTAAIPTLTLLIIQLENYRDILATTENPKGVKIVISGNQPEVSAYADYPDYIFFDYQKLVLTAELPWEKIALVSYSFRSISVWNGKGRMVEVERQKGLDLVGKVHGFNKPIRFWATPDSKTAWKALSEMGVDYINTDMPHEAYQYLVKLPALVYTGEIRHAIYKPTFETDGEEIPVNQIILMIGDGNGLAQLASGMFVNGNELNLTQLKNMGLVKTQAADDFTTDSAAGATAYATGHKTNNRFIGMLPSGEIIENLPNILNEYGFKSGIITTDKLSGATPAAFFAHVSERDDVKSIMEFLPKSHLDIFAAGGKSDLKHSSVDLYQELIENGFSIVDDWSTISSNSASKIAYFASEESLPTFVNGRGDYLKETTSATLKFLGKTKAPFFLMVESAMIDSGGHGNSSEMIVAEVLDFDQTIGEVIQYADQNPGTLVIITADHETGGVSIPQGSIADHSVELNYQSDDHTGIPVPIFAYGAHSGDFRGVYENTELFHRIVKLVVRYNSKK